MLTKLFEKVFKSKKSRANFIDRTLAGFVRKTERTLFAEEIARRMDGFLQKIDPRVKIIGFLSLIIAVATAEKLAAIFFIFTLAVFFAAVSRIPLQTLVFRAWLNVLIFTGIIVLPVIFITPGEELFRLPWLNLAISKQGMMSAVFLVSRVETSVTLSLILILTTLWTHLLKGLRILGVPVIFVVILAMTYRYIFVVLETAISMLEARKSRIIAPLNGNANRQLIAANIGNLFVKSIYLNNEIYLAMRSRGFQGEVYLLDDFKMENRDWATLVIFLAIAGFGFWLGRQN